MSKSYDFGQEAEKRAADFLEKKGYEILARNYRFLKAEIDLIAHYQNTLVIVEVKARSSSFFGAPQSFVGKKKRSLLIEAANHFILSRDLDLEVRFDIVSFVKNNSKWKVELLQNAFYPFT
tara:strand:+ start:3640 stop:4002 length:363 start_codon:yes stop_codon:yes gene_type:complete